MDILTVGSRIKLIRKKAGYTQGRLAETMTVSRSLIGAIESGQSNPTLDFLQRFVHQFKTSYAYLIEGVEATPETEGKQPNVKELPGYAQMIKLIKEARQNPESEKEWKELETTFLQMASEISSLNRKVIELYESRDRLINKIRNL